MQGTPQDALLQGGHLDGDHDQDDDDEIDTLLQDEHDEVFFEIFSLASKNTNL